MIDGWIIAGYALGSYLIVLAVMAFSHWQSRADWRDFPESMYFSLIVPILVALAMTLLPPPERGVAGIPETPPEMIVKQLSTDDLDMRFRFFSVQHQGTGQCFVVLGFNSGASITPAAPGVRDGPGH